MTTTNVKFKDEATVGKAEPLALIQSLFAAFQRGDVDFFINHVAEECPWRGTIAPDMPHGGRFNGRAGARKFFDGMLSGFAPDRLDFDRWVCQGEDVVAIGTWAGTALRTGKRYETPLALYFRVHDGRIVEFRGHEDTGVTAVALQA